MSEAYLVRCTAAKGGNMAGIYFANMTSNGMIATWKSERARRFENSSSASYMASRLRKNFAGTVWAPEPVKVDA